MSREADETPWKPWSRIRPWKSHMLSHPSLQLRQWKVRNSLSESSATAGVGKGKGQSSTTEHQSVDGDDTLFAISRAWEGYFEKTDDAPDVKVTFIGLFRYASRMDMLINLRERNLRHGAGAALPLFTVCTFFLG